MNFTQEEIHLIATMMDGASITEVKMFVKSCETYELSPFTGHIMPMKRSSWDSSRGENRISWAPLVKIDGLRAIAARTGEYEGQEGPFWCGPDGVWKDIWLDKASPSAAMVKVWRKGFRVPMSAVANFDSYAQKKKDGKLNQIWSSLGPLMIAKVAEALALRKSFPSEMAGAYSPEEMDQSGFVPQVVMNDVAKDAAKDAGISFRPGDVPYQDKPAKESVNANGEEYHAWTIDEKDQLDQALDMLKNSLFNGGLDFNECEARSLRYWDQANEGESFDKVMGRVANALERAKDGDISGHKLTQDLVDLVSNADELRTLIQYARKKGRIPADKPDQVQWIERGFRQKAFDTMSDPEKRIGFVGFMVKELEVQHDS